jgi:hypothetical protein
MLPLYHQAQCIQLVSISLETGADVNFTVPASAPTGPESLIKAVPSDRQKTSASSVSTRLHWRQRFMKIDFQKT